MKKKTDSIAWDFYDKAFEYQPMLDDFKEGWVGLRRVGYDLVSYLKPETIVELGTYKGTSFFSFAQAIKDQKLNTKLTGVDTWQGDIHTGFYTEEIYSQLKKILKTYYKNVDTSLLRMTFDEAVSKFPDNSIDLLHIDGLHTYEGVKHDFETWKNKVKKDGVVIFHDIYYFQRKFGVYKLWNELQKEYTTLELKHSNGLGILIKDAKTYEKLKEYEPLWQAYYPVKANNDELLHQLQNSKSGKLVKSLQDEIADLKANIVRHDQDMDSMRGQLDSITQAKFFQLWQQYCQIRDKMLGVKR